MRKKILLIITLILGISMLLCACGGKTEEEKAKVNKDIQEATAKEIGDYLLENIKFEDQPSSLDVDFVKELYLLEDEDIADYALYVATYTAEEVAVFKMDKDNDKYKKACEERLNIQKASFETYKSDEVEKIHNAYIYAEGNTVIMVVSSDKKAAEAAIKNFKK